MRTSTNVQNADLTETSVEYGKKEIERKIVRALLAWYIFSVWRYTVVLKVDSTEITVEHGY